MVVSYMIPQVAKDNDYLASHGLVEAGACAIQSVISLNASHSVLKTRTPFIETRKKNEMD